MISFGVILRTTDMGRGSINCITTSLMSFVLICSWLIANFDGHLARASAPKPAQLPSVFTTAESLSKLRNVLCGGCSQHGRDRVRQCREYGGKDACYLLCGCSNYGRRCLGEGRCACTIAHEEGCSRGHQTLCVFDDAFICSTSNDICMYYDEKKIQCECRDGWTGDNCQTCIEGSIGCKVDDKSLDPEVSGSDVPVKALVIGCSVCLIVGILLGVICMCRTGKLVCITSRVENQVGRQKDEAQERNPNPPAAIARKQSEHAYCHIIQYAVPEPPSSSHPFADISHNADYAEPNARHKQSSSSSVRGESNYYFKLEPTTSPVTYESVPPNKNNPAVTAPHRVKEKVASIDVTKPELDEKSGKREFQSKPGSSSSDEYDHLQRQVDVSISDSSRNYSHLALQEFL